MGEFFVYSFFFGALFTFFPVFVYADFYLDVAANKGWFSLSLYHRLRLLKGYAQLRREGIVFHLTKKKAFILPFAEMSSARKKFEITQGFQPWRFHQVLEMGGAEDVRMCMIAAAIRTFGGALYGIAKEKYATISLQNNVILYEESRLRVSVQTATVYNGLVLSMALGKTILEGIIEWMRKKRSTASWKRRQRSSQV